MERTKTISRAAALATGVLLVMLAAHSASVHAQPTPTAEIAGMEAKILATGHPARVIVGLNVPVTPEGRMDKAAAGQQRARIRAAQDSATSQLLKGPRTRLHRKFDSIPHFAAEVDAETLALLRSSPLVSSIQEDIAVRPSLLQSTALVNAPVVWNSGRTGSGWTVAVLDTGVDMNHPFLAGKVVSEACYSSNTPQSSSVCPGGVTDSINAGSGVNCNTTLSGCTHGTHVAGIVAGSGAGDGSRGVAPGANLIAVQVFSNFPGQGGVMSWTSDQIKGLERVYALRDTHKIAAVNMSLGGGQYSSTCDATQGAIKAVIDNLRSAGIATVIASGNDGYRNAISAPACISTAVSVGSVCDAGPDGSACATGVSGVASYSNIAPFVSLLAPGSYITSSIPGTGYAAYNGTSMAAPHVAGAWALLKQGQPTISVADGLALLRAGAVSVNDARSGGAVAAMSRINLSSLAGNAYTLTLTKAGAGNGTVLSAPTGVSCGSDCSETYAEGTMVSLNQTPAAGSTFAGWSGACSGTGACNVSMTKAQAVTATFEGAPYTLSLTKSGNGSGSVTSTPAGLSCTTSCSAAINGGTSVTLTAMPATGSRFEGWGGACTGSGACTVSMTAARSVTATFTLQSYAITVSKTGTGAGTVVSSPAGVNCGSTCSSTRPYGSVLTLKPTPAKGSYFAGWSGACSGTGACTVTVSQARNVGAIFTRTPLPLSVTLSGTGVGSVSSSPGGIDCGATCKYSMPADTQVTLTPSAANGSYFAGWRGSCTGTGACTVTMSAARSVTAVFTRHNYALSVSKSGNGSVTSSPAGISCGSTCKKTLASNTVVSLTAKPAKGWAFTGWSGECSGTSTCTVSMTSARSVAAAFSPI